MVDGAVRAHLPQGERFDSVDGWLQRVADTFAPAKMDISLEPFAGRMRSFEHAGLRISHVTATSHRLERTSRHLRADESSRYVLCVQLAGVSTVVQEGRMATLRPGDLTIYDTARPYTLVHDTDVTCLGVVIPAEALSFRPQTMDALRAVRMDAFDPVTALVAEGVAGFEARIGTLPALAQHRVTRSVVDLFETLCLHQATRTGTVGGDPRADQFDAVLRYIDEHLADPDLNPAKIAAAHFMSVRALHNLARNAGTTVAGWIRRRRLEQCRADLANPAFERVNVAAIGARWGLTHAPHFTTLFRSEFGATPNAYRRALLQSA